MSTEYGVLEINVAVVDSVDSASDHIAKYGTRHTEAIISQDQSSIDRFIALADCAAVMVNTSTRFTDGEQMGFGAEIGISNQKLHAPRSDGTGSHDNDYLDCHRRWSDSLLISYLYRMNL